jgi:hypothetical protein
MFIAIQLVERKDRQLKVPFRNFMSPVLFATAEASGQRKTSKK